MPPFRGYGPEELADLVREIEADLAGLFPQRPAPVPPFTYSDFDIQFLASVGMKP